MTALYPIQDTFVRGEVSPRLHARASLDLYRAGLAKCENFITLPHGGIRKRGGSYFVGDTRFSGASTSRLVQFIFSADQAYALEFGNLYLRVYAYGARVGTVQVTTPYPSSVLADLQFVQSADVMWIVHEDYAPRKLTRTAHTTWTLSTVAFTDGPFAAVNADDTNKMYASVATGAVSIFADSAVFQTDDIGRLVRIDMEDYSAITPWEPEQLLKPNTVLGDTVGLVRRYNGSVYACTASAVTNYAIRTGSTPPTHLHGDEYDGPNIFDTSYLDDLAQGTFLGVPWRYLHSGYGVARITSYVSTTQVNGTVVSRFPDEVVTVGNKSPLWRLGAFEPSGYADSVALFEERLTYGKRFSIYASKTGDFESFKLGETADSALQFIQAGGGQANDIVWLSEGDGALIIGTTGGIRALSGSGIDEALTPSSFKNRKSRTYGCARIAPVEAGSSFLYVTRSRKSIAELAQGNSGKFVSDDIGQVSEHICKQGVVTIAFQSDPDPLLWFPLENGEMGGFTYQPSQEVRGMHRHRLGGTFTGSDWAIVESCIVTPGQEGVDDVWMIVKRTIGGVTKRYIEIMTPPFEYGAVRDAFQVDCGLSYSGVVVGTVTGLSHLNGETVDVLAGGIVYRGLTVSAGSLTLPGGATATVWSVGLPFSSEADTLELDVGGKDGTVIGRRKKVHKVIFSLFETDTTGLEIASLLKGRWETAKIPSIVPPDGSANLFTGNIDVPVEDSWEGQARITIRHRNPTPCTIRAITPVFDSEP